MVAARPVALVGLPGTGKSTVAPLLAELLDAPAVDLDRAVEEAECATVGELFGRGEDVFRDAEARALAAALADGPAVVATGGGVVLREENRRALTGADVIWLRAPLALLVARLAAHAQRRPLLADDPAGALVALAGEREPLYRSVADVVVDIDGLDPEAVAARAARALAALGPRDGDDDRVGGTRG
ncbi:MAG: shikimate kinase [Microthrixaceae bacterium]